MQIDPPTLERARSANLVTLIQRHGIELKKAGFEFSGLCPFHSEKSPSFFVNATKNLYHCHACGASGDGITFLTKHAGLSFSEAVHELAGEISLTQAIVAHQPITPINEWERVTPIPIEAPNPPMEMSFKQNEQRVNRAVSTRWTYCNGAGSPLFHICRFETPKGKEIRPLTLWRNTSTGSLQWRWKSTPGPRPLFRFELLAAYPSARILLVEGERTCCAAQVHFDAAGFMQEHLIAMTWSGGTAGVGHTDFESLRGRKVALWPDADEPGLKAMRELAQKLLGIAAEVKLVLPPPGVPSGWDLADELPIGFDLRAHSKSAVLVVKSAVAVAVAEPAQASERDETSEIAETTTVVEPQQVGHPIDGVSIQGTLRALLPVELPFLADVRDGGTGRFALTELGNAWRILEKHGSDLRYLPEINHWLTWEGGAWRPDRDGGRVRGWIAMLFRDLLEEASTTVLSNDCEHVIKWSRKSQEARVIQNVANLVKDSSHIRVPLANVDGDPLLAGLDGGRQVIDLRTGQVRPAGREDYITRSLGINNVGDAAKAVRWLKFMDDIFLGDAELINWFKRFLGYCLTGLYSEQLFLFLHGGGSNGKGVLMKVLKLLFGGYFGTVATSTLMEQKRQGGGASPDIVGMAGYRLLMASETSSGSVFDEQFLKNWTGGDPQKARALYAKDELTFDPVGKLAIAGNHRPRISGTDYAIWRRLRLVPFRRTFKDDEKDEKLHERLGDELPHICAWIIEGCLEWQHRGLADTPSVIKEAGREYAEEQDTLGEFLEETVELRPGAECASSKIFDLYILWANRCNLKGVSRQAFGRQIAERGFTKTRDRYGVVYVGMGLKLPV